MQKNRVYIDSELKALIPKYLKNREDEIEKLKQLLKEKEYEEISYIGHSLKGSGGGYGFDFLTKVGKKLQDNAELKNANELKTLIENYELYLNNLEIIYQKV